MGSVGSRYDLAFSCDLPEMNHLGMSFEGRRFALQLGYFQGLTRVYLRRYVILGARCQVTFTDPLPQ